MIGTPTHDLAWVAAAPLWKGAARTPATLRRPTLLGFGHDGFMDELLGTLAEAPERIAERVVTGPSRSFRERRPGEAYDARPTVEGGRLKLYQPVHGWFYLVTGSLVCRRPGFPEHPVDLGAGERAGFVVRRVVDETSELALVVDPAGKRSWRPAQPPEVVAEDEEVLPLFPLAFKEAERRRRLLAGVIPTGNQDAFLAAPVGEGAPPAEGGKPPPAEAFEAVRARVPGAIRVLQAAPEASADQAEVTRFALMDLADFLTFHLPAVMENLKHETPLAGHARELAKLLREGVVDPTVDGKTLADLVATILDAPLDGPFAHNLRNADVGLAGELEGALLEAVEEVTPDAFVAAAKAPRIQDTLYATRLVYRRPRCAGLAPDVVSARSEPFLLAPYFDPEAPARPIRIALPFDASVKGLRQFRKNVRMVLSESLRQKTARKKLEDIDGPDLACGAVELSIPIITIVAMIVLFVMVSLLNLIFWWIPFVKICLPSVKAEP